MGTSRSNEASKRKDAIPRELFADFSEKCDQNISRGLRELFNRFFEKMTRTIGHKIESILNEYIHM